MSRFLAENDLPDTSCIHLASVIRNNQFLKKLILSRNHLYGPHFGNLMDALSSPTCKIEDLHLGSNDLTDISCTELASVIRKNQSMKKLILSRNHLSGPRFSDLMDALSSPDCRIEELHLADNDLPHTSCIQLASVIRKNQSLKKLILTRNRLSGPNFSDLKDALASPDCSIEELHLGSNNLFDHVIRNNQSQKILDLSDDLSSPACRIEELHLPSNELTEKEEEAIRETKIPV